MMNTPSKSESIHHTLACSVVLGDKVNDGVCDHDPDLSESCDKDTAGSSQMILDSIRETVCSVGSNNCVSDPLIWYDTVYAHH